MTRKGVYMLGLLLTVIVWSGCSDDEDPLNLEPDFTESDYSFTVIESIGDTEVIGTLMAEDNENESLTFSILLDVDGLFEIGASSGELSLASGKSLDYEASASHVIAVQVTDETGLSSEVSVAIMVTDDTSDNIKGAFAFTDSASYEGTAGTIEVIIDLDQTVLVEGASVVINVDAGAAVYGTDYTTVPAESSGTIEIPVEIGQTATSFTLEIFENLSASDDVTYDFTLDAGADNIIVPAETSASFTFTEDDEDDGTAYFVISSSTLYSVSTVTGQQTPYIEITLDGEPLNVLRSMDYVVSTKTMYGYGSDGGIYEIDLGTGEAKALIDLRILDVYGGNDAFPDGNSLEVIDGAAHAIIRTADADLVPTFYLVEYNLTTGDVTATVTDFPDIGFGLGYIGDKLYGAMHSGSQGYGLIELDPATGQLVDGSLYLPTPSTEAQAFLDGLGLDESTQMRYRDIDGGYAVLGIYDPDTFSTTSYLTVVQADGTLDFVTETALEGSNFGIVVVDADDLP